MHIPIPFFHCYRAMHPIFSLSQGYAHIQADISIPYFHYLRTSQISISYFHYHRAAQISIPYFHYLRAVQISIPYFHSHFDTDVGIDGASCKRSSGWDCLCNNVDLSMVAGVCLPWSLSPPKTFVLIQAYM